ncbi:glycosyltransferase family 2 protein [Nocardioides solisilvae]|uniref:glycosyltransferase family 2 protein n=1 Tax=Nocardioides solisilvae TaxID=1542435 RepID=UPI000D74BF26|nr:glycosyltransferase family 2 protein [Nocardioides solisilvae]
MAGAGTGTVVPTAALFRDVRVGWVGAPLVGAETTFAEPGPDDLRPVAAPGRPVPCGHPATLPGTALSQLLAQVRLDVTDPGPAEPAHTGPFLSVVVRTRGTRLLMLQDTFTSLAAQTDRDLEVLLACHRVAPEERARVRELVARQPAWLRDRVRVLDVDRPGRSAPLNDALDVADGRYVTVLDDDDTVLGHWVATFRALEERAPGRVLRAGSVRQHAAQLGEDGAPDGLGWPVVTAPPELAWPPEFDLPAHLHLNHTPNLAAAFPRGVVRHLGLRFDESLPTTEDWDFLVRAAAVVGVQGTPEVTSVYRWFAAASSRQEHAGDVWESGRRRVREGFDQMLMVLPQGSAALAAQTGEELYALRAVMAEQAAAERAAAEESGDAG